MCLCCCQGWLFYELPNYLCLIPYLAKCLQDSPKHKGYCLGKWVVTTALYVVTIVLIYWQKQEVEVDEDEEIGFYEVKVEQFLILYLI